MGSYTVNKKIDITLAWTYQSKVTWNAADHDTDVGDPPDASGIYALYYSKNVMYVGESGLRETAKKFEGSLRHRLKTHYREAVLCTNNTAAKDMSYYYALAKKTKGQDEDLDSSSVRLGTEAVLINVALLDNKYLRNISAVDGLTLVQPVMIDNVGEVPYFIQRSGLDLMNKYNDPNARKAARKLVIKIKGKEYGE